MWLIILGFSEFASPMQAFADSQSMDKCIKAYTGSYDHTGDINFFSVTKHTDPIYQCFERDGDTSFWALEHTKEASAIIHEKIMTTYRSLLEKNRESAIEIIKEHYLESYPQKQDYPPLGKALEAFFSKPSWDMSINKDRWVVVFNGVAKWGQNNARFTWTFSIKPKFKSGKLDGYSFNYSAKVNNNAVSNKVTNDMIGTVYLN